MRNLTHRDDNVLFILAHVILITEAFVHRVGVVDQLLSIGEVVSIQDERERSRSQGIGIGGSPLPAIDWDVGGDSRWEGGRRAADGRIIPLHARLMEGGK